MKIAFFVNAFPLLSETFILNQITGLIDRGHKVDIFTYKISDQPLTHSDVKQYKLLDQTFFYGNFLEEIPRNKITRILKALMIILTNLHKRPLPLIKALKVIKFGKEAASLQLLYKTSVFLDKGLGEYDIVHCHFGPNGSLGALLKDLGVIKGKLLTTFYGYDISSHVKKYDGKVYDRLFAKADKILCLSEVMREQLIRIGCDEQKISIHRLGISPYKFVSLPRELKDNGRIRLLSIGRLVEKKGIEFGIRAVAKVFTQHPEIEYRIAGDGPLRSKLEHLRDELGVRDSIQFLGWKEQTEIIDLIRNSDIFLAPSVTAEDGDQEGTPTVLIEAMASGLPVLSTRHSGIPEVVEDGKAGFLVKERDVDALAEKLIYLIKHKDAWPEFGEAGRRHILEHYNVDKLNDKLVSLYEQLLRKEQSHIL